MVPKRTRLDIQERNTELAEDQNRFYIPRDTVIAAGFAIEASRLSTSNSAGVKVRTTLICLG